MIAPEILAAVTAEPLVSKEEHGEEAWLDVRGEGVTASEVPSLSPASWERVLIDKLNGSSFSTAAMRKGHEREEFLLADLAWETTARVLPNSHVWAAAGNRRHLATPDGFAVTPDGVSGVEAKHHEHGWKIPANAINGIPADHYDQMQFGMHVTGLRRWIYVWEVSEADGSAPVNGPTIQVVEYDADRVAELVASADAFLAWVDAGAPVEQISDALADAKRGLLAARAGLDRATEAEKKARDRFEQLLAEEYPNAARTGWKHSDESGSVTLARAGRRVSLDEDAWEAAEPDDYVRYRTLTEQAAAYAATAKQNYPKTTYARPALRVNLPKGQKR